MFNFLDFFSLKFIKTVYTEPPKKRVYSVLLMPSLTYK